MASSRPMTYSNPPCPVCAQTPAVHFMTVDARDYWRCLRCEATYLQPDQLPSAQAEAELYQTHRNEVADPGYRRFLDKLAQPLLDRLSPGLQGLDYGCGPGPALAAMLRDAGQNMSVYDPLFFDDQAALERRYDFITCTEVVEHFHRPAQEFARLDSLLKAGGWLAIMTTFQTDDAAFAKWNYRRDPTHVVFYREATFHHLAGSMGWSCEIPCRNVALLRKPLA